MMTDLRFFDAPERLSDASTLGRFSPAIPLAPAQRKLRRRIPEQFAVARPEVIRSMAQLDDGVAELAGSFNQSHKSPKVLTTFATAQLDDGVAELVKSFDRLNKSSKVLTTSATAQLDNGVAELVKSFDRLNKSSKVLTTSATVRTPVFGRAEALAYHGTAGGCIISPETRWSQSAAQRSVFSARTTSILNRAIA